MPTILDLLGIPVPLEQLKVPRCWESRDNMALFFTDYSLVLLGLRDGCWKYILEVDSQRSKLYDVCVDREETKDRSVNGESARESVQANSAGLDHGSGTAAEIRGIEESFPALSPLLARHCCPN